MVETQKRVYLSALKYHNHESENLYKFAGFFVIAFYFLQKGIRASGKHSNIRIGSIRTCKRYYKISHNDTSCADANCESKHRFRRNKRTKSGSWTSRTQM